MLTYQKKGIYLQVAYDIRTARTITSYAKESNSTLQIHRTCYTYIKHTYTCLHTAQTKPNNNKKKTNRRDKSFRVQSWLLLKSLNIHIGIECNQEKKRKEKRRFENRELDFINKFLPKFSVYQWLIDWILAPTQTNNELPTVYWSEWMKSKQQITRSTCKTHDSNSFYEQWFKPKNLSIYCTHLAKSSQSYLHISWLV